MTISTRSPSAGWRALRRLACKCSLRSAGRFGLRRGRGRNDGRLPFAPAVACRSGASRLGRTVGSSWIRRHLDRTLHWLFVEVSTSGFRDHDWLARPDDSDPGGALVLELGPRSGASLNPGVDLKLYVKSHGTWEVVDKDEVVLMPDKVIRCRFDLNHEVFPGGFYDVRWFRADDRGKHIDIARERFQLRNHSIGGQTRSVSRTNRILAPKGLPTSEDEIKPRRAVEVR